MPRMTRKNVPEDLFARLVPTDGCLIYSGRKSRKGYGLISWAGRTVTTHRLAYILANGAIPQGKHVLHTCDRPACCNPQHLKCGTNVNNVQDMLDRGRSRSGNRHPRRKLTSQDVKEIRVISGQTHRALARLYGVGWRAIQKIRKGQRWKEG